MLEAKDLKRKPAWLDKKIDRAQCHELSVLLGGLRLATICQQALCPNISECFHEKVATFLMLGKTCTRNCQFCAVKKGVPEAVDYDEPQRIVEAVRLLGLRHVVITSVTRDDLPDGGAGIFSETIKALRSLDDTIAVEVLVPDFEGNNESVKKVATANPSVFAHNLETIPSLYPYVRQGADYERSLAVLEMAKHCNSRLHTKSGIMVGLGETTEQVLNVLRDLRRVGCDFLSIGQYLAPSADHYPVKEFIEPRQFVLYKDTALSLGFVHVESGPYVRSSYCASRYL